MIEVLLVLLLLCNIFALQHDPLRATATYMPYAHSSPRHSATQIQHAHTLR
jgi:hypothetical protein